MTISSKILTWLDLHTNDIDLPSNQDDTDKYHFEDHKPHLKCRVACIKVALVSLKSRMPKTPPQSWSKPWIRLWQQKSSIFDFGRAKTWIAAGKWSRRPFSTPCWSQSKASRFEASHNEDIFWPHLSNCQEIQAWFFQAIQTHATFFHKWKILLISFWALNLAKSQKLCKNAMILFRREWWKRNNSVNSALT